MTFTPIEYLPYDFANRRHIGPSPSEMADMLKTVGVGSLQALIDDTVPQAIRQKEPLDFGKAKSEQELLFFMHQTASKNKVLTSLTGVSRDGHAAGNPAQYSGEPCLVHGLYAVSARDFARAA